MSVTLANFQPNLESAELKKQKSDNTSFTGNPISDVQSIPVQKDSKEVRQFQVQQMKHNALNNLSFTGKIIEEPVIRKIETRTPYNDHGIPASFYTPSRSDTITTEEVIEKKGTYKPDCWETLDSFPNIECDIQSAFKREESLLRSAADKHCEADSYHRLAMRSASFVPARESNSYFEGGLRGFIEEPLCSVTGALVRFILDPLNEKGRLESNQRKENMKNSKEQAIKYEKYAQKLKREAECFEKESNTLKVAREKGTLIDISVRNIDNPNQPFENFLRKAKNEPNNLSWVEETIVALPSKTMKMADAVLMALGNTGAKVKSMNKEIKCLAIKDAITETNFIEKALEGLGQIIKYKKH